MRNIVLGLLVILAAATGAAATVKPLEHEMLVRVQASPEALRALQAAGLYIYEFRDGWIKGAITPTNARNLDALGDHYEVLIPDMVKYGEALYAQPGSPLGVYHTYQQMLDTFNTIATNNPSICHLETLSMTSTGKYVIALEITQNPGQDNHRPRVLWDGSTHGNEQIGFEVCWYYVQELVGKYGSDAMITQLVNTRDIWIVPCFNPEGMIAHTRVNANGIDLNRENGYAWDNASNAPAPFSQAETRGYRKFFQSHHFTLDMTYHSGATTVMWPWGWTNNAPPDTGIMTDMCRRYADTTGLDYGQIPSPHGVGYLAPGGSTDFYYGCEGSLGYAAEISSGQYPDPPPTEIDTIAHANWTASRDLMVRGGWGIRGQVTDSTTGLPVKKAIVFTTPSGWLTYPDSEGWYFRCTYAGTYAVKVMADGYVTKTVTGVTVPSDSYTVVNVPLARDTTGPITGYKLSSWVCDNPSAVGNSQGPSVLGRRDSQALTLASSSSMRGWATIELSRPVLKRPGTSFTVYSTSNKPCSVYVSADSFQGPWHFCTYASGTIPVNLNGSGVTSAHYVRIVDGGQGYDLDAIEGIVTKIPNLAYDALRIVDSTGNANGILDPGERAQFVISLLNTGDGAADSISGRLTCPATGITIPDSLASFGTIVPESGGSNNADRFVVHADSNILPGTPAQFTLYLAAGSYADTIRFNIEVGRIQISDPIPDGPRKPARYYAYDDVDRAYAQHPVFQWAEVSKIGTHLTLGHNQTQHTLLPASFGPWYFYGQRYTQLSICSNGWVSAGLTSSIASTSTRLPNDSIAPPSMIALCWNDLDPTGSPGIWLYGDTINHRLIIEYDSVIHYGRPGTYEKFELVFYDTTVVTATGDNVLIAQYQLVSDFSEATVGIQDPTQAIGILDVFDDTYNLAAAPIQAGRAIEYVTGQPTLTLAERSAVSPRRILLAVSPNPAHAQSSIRFALPAEGRVSLAVYDASGRLLRTLTQGRFNAGAHMAVWNRLDAQGRRVGAGVYFIRLATSQDKLTTKAILLE